MLRALSSPLRWFINVQKEHIAAKRHVNGLSSDYRTFKRSVWNRDDEQIFEAFGRRDATDKWINLADIAMHFYRAAGAPSHVTGHDYKTYVKPLFGQIRRGIEGGAIEAYRDAGYRGNGGVAVPRVSTLWADLQRGGYSGLSGALNRVRESFAEERAKSLELNSVSGLDGFTVRFSDVWDVLVAADLPDGGRDHEAPSLYAPGHLNREVPRPVHLEDGVRQEYLNIRLPFMYALLAAEDKTKHLQGMHHYQRLTHGRIPNKTDTPYML